MVAGLLVVVVLGVGLLELTRPRPALVVAGQGWAEDYPDSQRPEHLQRPATGLALLVAVGRFGPSAL